MRSIVYVSIPVHENIPAIIDQVKNIHKYLSCKIILHISKSANFSKKDLLKSIESNHLQEKTFINPESVQTRWGSIINAHISNFHFIKEECNASNDDKIIFHASNDMLVRKGLQKYIEANENLFNLRIYDRDGYWWPANIALQDQKLLDAINIESKTCARVVASQIEGSMYKFSVLEEIVQIIEKYSLLTSELNYTREEIFFSTIAYALGVRPTGTPYIYSEVHKFDKNIWKLWLRIDENLKEPVGRRLKHLINKWYFKSKYYKINKPIIDAIRKNKIELYQIYDAGMFWKPYQSPESIFGVKRIERDTENKLRIYINKLD